MDKYKVKLKPGEVECDECQELRDKREKDLKEKPWRSSYYISCPKCKGSGKLDWVENIVGKNDNDMINLAPGMILGNANKHPNKNHCVRGDTYLNNVVGKSYIFDGIDWIELSGNSYYS